MKAAASRPHESARGHVTGEALYTDDLLNRFPNLLHAWPVMAPHAHANVTSLDVAPAFAAGGHDLTAADAPGEGNTGANRHDEPLFPTEVMHHGQPVAWVLGETLEAAQREAARVPVEYEPLRRSSRSKTRSRRAASIPGRTACPAASVRDRASPLRIEGELRIGGQEHFYLETQCCHRVDATRAGGVSLHSSTQHPAETQEVVARVLGMPRNQVTVECLRMGGAFGGKEVQANPWAAIAALGAWKTGRPVRVRLTRELDMALTGKRHPYLARLRRASPSTAASSG